MKLIKLELTKDNFMKYIWGAIISTVCAIAVVALIGCIQDEGDTVFTSAYEILEMGDIFIRAIYIVFSGVLIANIIVGEFTNDTIKNLFIYPISRKKIMASKLVLVFMFTFIMYVVSAYVFYLSMAVLNAAAHMVPEAISAGMMIARIPTVLSGGLLTAGISLIALFFGMKKKSISVTIVSSVVIMTILSNSIDGTMSSNLFSVTFISVGLCLLGIAIGVSSFLNINKVDIN